MLTSQGVRARETGGDADWRRRLNDGGPLGVGEGVRWDEEGLQLTRCRPAQIWTPLAWYPGTHRTSLPLLGAAALKLAKIHTSVE